jgi:hypothetical protein
MPVMLITMTCSLAGYGDDTEKGTHAVYHPPFHLVQFRIGPSSHKVHGSGIHGPLGSSLMAGLVGFRSWSYRAVCEGIGDVYEAVVPVNHVALLTKEEPEVWRQLRHSRSLCWG